MFDEKWNKRFLKIAYEVAEWSKDRSTKVGSVIIDENKNPRSFGFNGMPRGIDDDQEHRHERPAKYSFMEHAERNGIYNCSRVGIPVAGCTLYCTHHPCSDCVRAIIQCGITAVVISSKAFKESFNDRWAESFVPAKEMLKEAGIELVIVDFEDDE